MGLISQKLDIFTKSLVNPRYWEWAWLYSRYYSHKKGLPFNVRFLGYRADIPDGPSFVYQYKDIFFREEYMFRADSPDPVILDCGANIGLSCLYFKRLYPRARIRAFEADPLIAAILSKNLLQNGVTDIEVIPKAVWTDNQGLAFFSDGADGGNILGVPGASGARVDSIRLADVLETEPRVDLLKIDIEGAEGAVLADCGLRLGRVRKLFVEYHSFPGRRQELGELLSLLEGQGFRYHISPVTKIEHPFTGNPVQGPMDLQLNIFAHKT